MRKQSIRIQVWPSGKGYEFTGDPDGPANQKKMRVTSFNGDPVKPWRTGTAEEWRAVRVAQRAERYRDHEILACQSGLIDDLIKHSPGPLDGFGIDDIENLYPNPEEMDAEECREWITDHMSADDLPAPPTVSCDDETEAHPIPHGSGDSDHTGCQKCQGSGEITDPNADDDRTYLRELSKIVNDKAEAAEVYEWWLVSSWLCGQLRAIGEPVIDNGHGTWWGRTCTGQSLIMDGTLQKIAASFEDNEGDKRKMLQAEAVRL